MYEQNGNTNKEKASLKGSQKVTTMELESSLKIFKGRSEQANERICWI